MMPRSRRWFFWHAKAIAALVAPALLPGLQATSRSAPVAAAPLRVESVSSGDDRSQSTPREQQTGVIFSDDFEADPGTRYFEYGREGESFVWKPGEGYTGSGAMRCQFEKGQVGAGSLKVVFGKNPFNKGVRREEMFREVFWRVYVKHEPGWEGSPHKLARATCMAGGDWSQGMIAHVWSGKADALCIDPATGIRDSRKVSTRYNDFANLKWLGVKHASTPLFHADESGRWVCVESQVRLNTPGRQDGIFRLWVDGKLEAEHTALNWHGEWQEFGINALFLENYWNDGALKRQARWFDNLVISTRPIGPVGTPANPTVHLVSAGDRAWQARVSPDLKNEDVVWQSFARAANEAAVTIDQVTGNFEGSMNKVGALQPGRQHWVSLRQRLTDGNWGPWSPWHSPFLTASTQAG